MNPDEIVYIKDENFLEITCKIRKLKSEITNTILVLIG